MRPLTFDIMSNVTRNVPPSSEIADSGKTWMESAITLMVSPLFARARSSGRMLFTNRWNNPESAAQQIVQPRAFLSTLQLVASHAHQLASFAGAADRIENHRYANFATTDSCIIRVGVRVAAVPVLFSLMTDQSPVSGLMEIKKGLTREECADHSKNPHSTAMTKNTLKVQIAKLREKAIFRATGKTGKSKLFG